MKILTKEIERRLPPLGSTEGKDPEDVSVPLKVFNPYGPGTWYIFERDPETNLCFGVAKIFETELGYIDLNELISVRVPPFGLSLERDRYWSGTLKDVAEYEGIDFLLK